MDTHAGLEGQIDRWRGYVLRHQAISAADVDELEDHLREQIADRRATGLDDEEAFLVAIKRLGNLDQISREFAREHSERLWKQLVLVPADTGGSTPAWRELVVVLCLALGAGATVKAGIAGIGTDSALVRNLGLLVMPFATAYFAWKRHLARPVLATIVVSFAALAAVLNLYPFTASGSTEVLAALHAPVVLWLLLGLAYVGGRWRSDRRRMDFVRFTGELVIYLALLALGGAVLVGLTLGTLSLIGVDFEPVLEDWILPFAVPGALVVAAWLVEAKQQVVENIAPVLTKVFTPLTVVMLLVLLSVLVGAGDLNSIDRDLLILMDAILVLVLGLVLYSVSARDPLTPPGLFDALQVALVTLALAVDAVMLTAMLTRLAEFGASPNRLAALGLNVLLLVHLVRAAWLAVGFLRGRRAFAALERWQTRYLPVYALWAAVVVLAFPPLFGFS
ncbi:permease prefix domain 1-containing protein [Arthrobacter burdickii]|uniref:Permease prefix domain 1-containing protein n=1 Tax=Arthrobacter burdickii TaxID=3035920 RepID=A0ABT8JXR9_9MICC|nr:permease prefix domain 1-containing protein [Arthrobacter burdickii]MDN4609966.1 permease prefix domain 1-containing protein [Arthrobacter burdickii]